MTNHELGCQRISQTPPCGVGLRPVPGVARVGAMRAFDPYQSRSNEEGPSPDRRP